MKIIETGFDGLYELEPNVFGDKRGYFFESFKKSLFVELGITEDFVQDNESFSVKGTLRGLHYQQNPHAQAKLVRVVSGKVLDVAVDLRKDSPTFGKHHTVILDAEKHNMFLVPAGFGHGFVALEDSVFTYKCSNYYNKESEGGVLWSDPVLNIDWGIENPIVSEKDQVLPTFDAYKQNPVF
ncbi:dTDP-4-dehydrorhamnose 3,5-epimerase [Roseivirga pacifica]|uniref:dTDP-4-dehydrorhamnose 3,5-epimerase n=1 Tax=Roseivirga pacifica TaxID=1267423 RepID=A0A1I0NAN8_9BACT|nr:dTDP-4-dehydrorhamnose 3,5-epimerase [Roseivirga pacifica]MCO6359538.1 dTDP-4-dehydrorhamnose 3,5-epimerase [Roseivirga pacifica]MCO6366908.1 dTDP-4-dehydrorhamnose 3,5-epimerase [Roseivirga pacifica]MCO6370560.1 dTDP-4-dehydrorhamnose 3,5-epimerase [Roseivirga pacifica]MCO6374565.1 dTDP-4-dehydrorhamnose 3,5-epimerase [Roseivirga pacifica]MCO6379823.1 dTDP-4-dehydrorhamnose 3,5-epimerase [Roseivirga pacifica]